MEYTTIEKQQAKIEKLVFIGSFSYKLKYVLYQSVIHTVIKVEVLLV